MTEKTEDLGITHDLGRLPYSKTHQRAASANSANKPKSRSQRKREAWRFGDRSLSPRQLVSIDALYSREEQSDKYYPSFSLDAFRKIAPDMDARFDPAWAEYETNDSQLAFPALSNRPVLFKLASEEVDPWQ